MTIRQIKDTRIDEGTRLEISGRTQIGFGWVGYQDESVEGPDRTFTVRQLERGDHFTKVTEQLERCAYFVEDKRLAGFIFSKYDKGTNVSYETFSYTPDGDGTCVAVVFESPEDLLQVKNNLETSKKEKPPHKERKKILNRH